MSKKYNVSTLENIIHQAWAETNLEKAKTIVSEHVMSTQIKSKDTILQNLQTIHTKSRLDSYLANSLLSFEGLKV